MTWTASHFDPPSDPPPTIDHLWVMTDTAGRLAHEHASRAKDPQVSSVLNFTAYILELAADDLHAAGALRPNARPLAVTEDTGEFTSSTVMHLRDACVQVIDYTHNPHHAEAALAVLALTDDLAALLDSNSPAAGPHA